MLLLLAAGGAATETAAAVAVGATEFQAHIAGNVAVAVGLLLLLLLVLCCTGGRHIEALVINGRTVRVGVV